MTRVLVIEDDHSVSMAIQNMLAHRGCVTVLASDAHQGAQALESSKCDVMIIDIFIPGTDGLKTIKEFHERMPTVPIIAMTGFRFSNSMSPTLDFLGMAAQLGATCCLRKPFSSQQLMAAINSSLKLALVSGPSAENIEPA